MNWQFLTLTFAVGVKALIDFNLFENKGNCLRADFAPGV